MQENHAEHECTHEDGAMSMTIEIEQLAGAIYRDTLGRGTKDATTAAAASLTLAEEFCRVACQEFPQRAARCQGYIGAVEFMPARMAALSDAQLADLLADAQAEQARRTAPLVRIPPEQIP